MGKFDGYMIMCDMDGTLLSSDSTISEENASKIKYFMSEGGLFAFASGRNPQNLRAYFESITPNAPCICYNGAMIYDFQSDTVLEEKTLPDSARSVLCKALESLTVSGFIVETIDGFNLLNKNEATDTLLRIVPDAKAIYVSSIDDIKKPWIKIDFWQRPCDFAEIEAFMKSVSLPNNLRFLRTHEWAVEILRTDSDKGYCFDALKKHCNAIKGFVALGDNENDRQMLANADYSFMPSNANESLRGSVAERLPYSNNESFVARAVDALERAIAKEKCHG